MKKNYIKEQFVTYEIALAMKELGFNEPCLGYFPNVENSDKTMIFFDMIPEYTTNNLFDENPTNYHFTAPLWQQCIEWFRIEYNMYIWISCTPWLNSYSVNYNLDNNIIKDMVLYANYQEAREQAILKAIELCKKS